MFWPFKHIPPSLQQMAETQLDASKRELFEEEMIAEAALGRIEVLRKRIARLEGATDVAKITGRIGAVGRAGTGT